MTPPCMTAMELSCAHNITVDYTNCPISCNGLMVTSYSKSDLDKNLESYIPITMNAYRQYKKWFQYNPAMKGLVFLIYCIVIIELRILYFRICVGKQVEICEDLL